MRIKIDRQRCTGHGRCYALAPEVIDADDDGYGVTRHEVVADEVQDAARQGARNWPEDATEIHP